MLPVAVAVATSAIGLSACDPAPIGAGCQFAPDRGQLAFNQNNNGDEGEGVLVFAAVDGANFWREANSAAPDIYGSWPAPPVAGKGVFELREFTSAQSSNSGYTSTTGPTGFPAPPCGSSTWASKPHVWLNRTLATQRANSGQANWNVSTATHELGHVLGLADNHNDACADVNAMESTSAHGYIDCGVYKPTPGDVRSVDGISN